MDFLDLPKRTTGIRKFGLTSIADFGIPLGRLKDTLDDFSHIIDIAKISIGSAYVTPNLQKKVDLYKNYQVIPYCGGTLFEKSYYQKKVPEYLNYLRNLGVNWIEISAGTLDIPLRERLNLISNVKDEFHIVAEVGSKDTEQDMSIKDWKEEIQLFLEAGCEYVITEGRGSGTAGIYEKNGQIKSELISELIHSIDPKKIIFEAPSAEQQMYFINHVGPNVNLGNVKIDDALLLEAQRIGLRSETFYMEDCNAAYLNQAPAH